MPQQRTAGAGASVTAPARASGIPAAQIDPTIAAFLDAWNAGNQERFVAQFADDAVLIDGSSRYEGTVRLRDAASSHVTGYRVRVPSAEPKRADGQTLLVQVTPASGGDGFRARFDFTVANGRIASSDWQYA